MRQSGDIAVSTRRVNQFLCLNIFIRNVQTFQSYSYVCSVLLYFCTSYVFYREAVMTKKHNYSLFYHRVPINMNDLKS